MGCTYHLNLAKFVSHGGYVNMSRCSMRILHHLKPFEGVDSMLQGKENDFVWKVYNIIRQPASRTETEDKFRSEFPGPLGYMLALGAQWSNDIIWIVEEFYGIKSSTSSCATWKLEGRSFIAFSDEFYQAHYELVKERYAAKSAESQT